MRMIGLRVAWICLILISILGPPSSVESQEPPSENSYFGYPADPVNFTHFWALFNTHSYWDLEANTGSGWFSIKSDLNISREFPDPGICKITLIFEASYSADYRLTFGIDLAVREYIHREAQATYILSYLNYSVFFCWEDILEIPGLIITHGILDDIFWFRIRRNSVPQGILITLDPTFGYSGQGGSTADINDYIRGSWFQISEKGVGKSITAYVRKDNTSYTAQVKYALYSAVPVLQHYLPGSPLAETNPYIISTGLIGGWITANFISSPSLENGETYYLLAWASAFEDKPVNFYHATESQKGAYNQSEYGSWPSDLSGASTSDRRFSIYCTYSAAPSIGGFSSDNPVYGNSWFGLNATLQDEGGISEIKNCTLELSHNIILGWDNATESFTIESDPYSYCVLNSSASSETELNSSTLEISWRIQLKNTYPHGSSVSVIADNTEVYDTYGLSGSGSYSGLFIFEPEEAWEPGAPTERGGARRTPLEKLGVPTPLPYEVAPPEAQYGSIGLIIIISGASVYYISGKKTTRELWKENTASRIGYKKKSRPKKRKVHSKKRERRPLKRTGK